ncbi:MAG: hypothetical protein J7L95_08360 [Prolixibacteraceae bacterium]|nr:hypothetical protein [Prolixibacteraceae bacterium]
MPQIEKQALHLCRGKVLDVGAAAGCHSVILQKNGLNVTALEKSPFANLVLQKRGIKNVVCKNIFSFANEKFDTILNGCLSISDYYKKLRQKQVSFVN